MPQLFKHQQDFLALNPHRSALIWSCGTGKTRTAIEWAKLEGTPTLVICPKALKTNWQREGKKWGFHVTVMSKEEFRRDWGSFVGSNIKQVIVDEVHNGFLTPLFKSQMSKSLRKFLMKTRVNRTLLLTATPFCSSPWNVFNLAYFCGQDWNYKKFEQAFFNFVRMGPRMVPVAKKGSEAKLAKLVKKFASVVDIHDVMDVPLQHHTEPEYFALTPKQEIAIKEAYDPLPIVRYTKQHQIENGILIGNEFAENRVFLSDKMDRLLDLVKENKKIAIICRYNYQIDELYKLTKQIKDTLIIRGDVKDRDAVTLKAESAENCVVLIQAESVEGYQLPSFELCVFASMSYAYTKWEQVCGRFLRMDKPSRTTFVYLLTEGDSIDQAVYDCVQKKMDFKIELYKK